MHNTLHDEAFERYLKQVNEFYVSPELAKRTQNGSLRDNFTLTSFQVVISLDKPVEVRFNNEVKGVLNIEPKESLSFGDLVPADKIESIKGFKLLKEDANSAHVTYISLPNGSSFLTSDYRYNTLIRKDRLDTSIEFLEAARSALNSSHYRAFHKNLFASMEAGIAALLTSLPDKTYLNTKTHDSWKARINKWGQLGNVNKQFVKLFNRLAQDRNRARYGKFTIDWHKAAEMIALARQFLETIKTTIQEFH